jgi:hypothetical protein
MPSSNLRQAQVDMASALKDVFKKYVRSTRKKAWDAITSKKGHEEMDKLITQPSRPISRFRALNFREWMGPYGNPKKDKVWYVVQSKQSKKFADGWYGWDANILDNEQIFSQDELPYVPNENMDFIEVGRGKKPSPEEVRKTLGTQPDHW